MGGLTDGPTDKPSYKDAKKNGYMHNLGKRSAWSLPDSVKFVSLQVQREIGTTTTQCSSILS